MLIILGTMQATSFAGEGSPYIDLAWENINLGMNKYQFERCMGDIEVTYQPISPTDLYDFYYINDEMDGLINVNLYRIQLLESMKKKGCEEREAILETRPLEIDGCYEVQYKRLEKTTITPSIDLIPYFAIPEGDWTEATLYFLDNKIFHIKITLRSNQYLEQFHRNYAKFIDPDYDQELGFLGLKDDQKLIIGTLTSCSISNATVSFYNRSDMDSFHDYLVECRNTLYDYLRI